MPNRVSKKTLLSILNVRELRKLAVSLGVKAPSKKTKDELMTILLRKAKKIRLEDLRERVGKYKEAAT